MYMFSLKATQCYSSVWALSLEKEPYPVANQFWSRLSVTGTYTEGKLFWLGGGGES